MSEEVLAWMDTLLSGLGINYQYGIWSIHPVPFPYFVGEMDEDPLESEDGMQQCTFMLTGTGRSLLELGRVKNEIKKLNGTRAILENGSGVALFYDGAYSVPIDEADMRRMQVNLQIKEWRVN